MAEGRSGVRGGRRGPSLNEVCSGAQECLEYLELLCAPLKCALVTSRLGEEQAVDEMRKFRRELAGHHEVNRRTLPRDSTRFVLFCCYL